MRATFDRSQIVRLCAFGQYGIWYVTVWGTSEDQTLRNVAV